MRDSGFGARDSGKDRADKAMLPLPKEVHSYEDLLVWREAMRLVEEVYRIAGKLPMSEKFGIVSQMTRAAVSVPANIAESHASDYRRVFLNHLSLSRGSLMELGTYLTLVVSLGFLNPEQVAGCQRQLARVGQLLNALMRALRRPPTGSANEPQ